MVVLSVKTTASICPWEAAPGPPGVINFMAPFAAEPPAVDPEKLKLLATGGVGGPPSELKVRICPPPPA